MKEHYLKFEMTLSMLARMITAGEYNTKYILTKILQHSYDISIGNSGSSMIIYGTSGAGKTYLIAQAVSSIKVTVSCNL